MCESSHLIIAWLLMQNKKPCYFCFCRLLPYINIWMYAHPVETILLQYQTPFKRRQNRSHKIETYFRSSGHVIIMRLEEKLFPFDTRCVLNERFPVSSIWDGARLVPIFKKGRKAHLGNY